jgi:F-type H+-transporting ATPase subunit a
MDLLRINREIPGIGPDTVFSIGNFPIANTTLMMVFIIFLILIGAFVMRKRDKLIPASLQNFVEAFYEYVFDLVNQVTGNRKVTNKIFPLVGSLFVFILLSNIGGLLPLISEITWNGVSVFRAPTSDFNTTFALAFSFLFLIQFEAIRTGGIFAYIGKFFQFKQVWVAFRKSVKDGMIALIMFGIGILDIISEIAKVVSLSLRLFGNMYAGQVLSMVILAGFAYGLPAIWMSLNVLSAVVQTIVFALLVTAYYSTSVKTEEIINS